MESEIFMWQVHHMLKGKEGSTAGVLIDWLHARKGIGQIKVRMFRFFL